MSNEERKRRARQVAEARYGFLWHLPIYIIVNLGLVAIWYYTSGPTSFPWPIFPIFFWGLGVFAHYMSAYRSSGGGWIGKRNRKDTQERRRHGKVLDDSFHF